MINPGKAVFRYLANYLKITELECYTLYLDNALDFRLNFNSLADNLETDNDIAQDFYGSNDDAPKFFNYKKYTDWSRLNNSLMPQGEFLCFYEYRKIHKNQYKWIKIYDESTTSYLFKRSTQKLVPHCFILKHDENSNYYIE